MTRIHLFATSLLAAAIINLPGMMPEVSAISIDSDPYLNSNFEDSIMTLAQVELPSRNRQAGEVADASAAVPKKEVHAAPGTVQKLIAEKEN
jgi:hypothetical protein